MVNNQFKSALTLKLVIHLLIDGIENGVTLNDISVISVNIYIITYILWLCLSDMKWHDMHDLLLYCDMIQTCSRATSSVHVCYADIIRRGIWYVSFICKHLCVSHMLTCCVFLICKHALCFSYVNMLCVSHM